MQIIKQKTYQSNYVMRLKQMLYKKKKIKTTIIQKENNIANAEFIIKRLYIKSHHD